MGLLPMARAPWRATRGIVSLMHFRRIKDVVAFPIHRFGFFLAGLPPGLARACLASLCSVARAAYFLPGAHARLAITNFCRVTHRTDHHAIWSRMVDNIENAALHYARLYRYGRGELLSQTRIDPSWATEYKRLRSDNRGIIVLVPHCIAAVLSSAGLHNFSPTVLLVREPKSQERCQLMLDYVQKLGPKWILSRNTPPATVMRNIARALRAGEVVVGTTDVLGRKGEDTIEARVFGQRIYSPAWPARLASRFNIPIAPGFIRMEGNQITLLSDEAYVESDVEKSTQRWVSSFERWFRQYPSDWAFMLDKSWARLFAAALKEPSESNIGLRDLNMGGSPQGPAAV
jgi:lauroyl/myristoyl acyltransferase